MTNSTLPRTREAIETGIERGLQRGGQLYVSRGGEVLADVAFGEARPGVPMETETIVTWMSAGKPLTAVLIGLLRDRGELSFDDRVAAHLPEFAGGGKEPLTLRHLLTHTAGLQEIETGWPDDSWDEIVSTVCRGTLADGWVPGERAAYDRGNSWFVLGEIAARIVGRPFGEALRDELLEPLGMARSWCGVPAEVFHRERDRLGWTFERSRNGLVPREWQNAETAVTSAAPGGNCRGPIRELGRFYEALLGILQGESTPLSLSTKTVQEMTRRHRVDRYDETFRHEVDFGLGVILDSSHHGPESVPYGYGEAASPSTFGHGGAQSAMGFCDPERELVVAWMVNGMVGEPKHHARNRAINDAVWADLGFDADAGSTRRRSAAGGRNRRRGREV